MKRIKNIAICTMLGCILAFTGCSVATNDVEVTCKRTPDQLYPDKFTMFDVVAVMEEDGHIILEFRNGGVRSFRSFNRSRCTYRILDPVQIKTKEGEAIE